MFRGLFLKLYIVIMEELDYIFNIATLASLPKAEHVKVEQAYMKLKEYIELNIQLAKEQKELEETKKKK